MSVKKNIGQHVEFLNLFLIINNEKWSKIKFLWKKKVSINISTTPSHLVVHFVYKTQPVEPNLDEYENHWIASKYILVALEP